MRGAGVLRVRVGQHSTAGRKPANQDFHGACLAQGAALAAKGVALAVADGISSSDAAAQASQAAVTSFLEDYYATPDAWSVKHAAERVLAAANGWLFAQTQAGAGRWDKDRGWVCTFSALVAKGRTAHLFHVGDARIWQLQGRTLEALTTDHRVHAGGETYLGRALGIAPQVEIDYRALELEAGDCFVLTTDGVHGHLPPEAMAALLQQHRDAPDDAARAIAQLAFDRGSDDNLTVQVLYVDELPDAGAAEVLRQAAGLAHPPRLAARAEVDGYTLVRELHASSRSHAWLAEEGATGASVVLKFPSTELREDPAALERFLLEEWVARRVDSAHLLKASAPAAPRRHLYSVMEHVQGQTLAQWMRDHPQPPLEAVRAIVRQLARGLRALHRADMVHRDLRPENVMIDAAGTVKIIDFGAARVAGLHDDAPPGNVPPGLAQYTAPECFLGDDGTPASDLFSLAVITYQMLCGRLPYGMEVPKCRSLAQQRRLHYASLHAIRRDVPAWVDDALRQALDVQPERRPADVSEFAYALEHPTADARAVRVPLAQRDPLTFWRTLALVLAVACVGLLGFIAMRH
jgi:serine/threonine protein phosphatase PrpC